MGDVQHVDELEAWGQHIFVNPVPTRAYLWRPFRDRPNRLALPLVVTSSDWGRGISWGFRGGILRFIAGDQVFAPESFV